LAVRSLSPIPKLGGRTTGNRVLLNSSGLQSKLIAFSNYIVDLAFKHFSHFLNRQAISDCRCEAVDLNGAPPGILKDGLLRLIQLALAAGILQLLAFADHLVSPWGSVKIDALKEQSFLRWPSAISKLACNRAAVAAYRPRRGGQRMP
jgi:hypothetical protein